MTLEKFVPVTRLSVRPFSFLYSPIRGGNEDISIELSSRTNYIRIKVILIKAGCVEWLVIYHRV